MLYLNPLHEVTDNKKLKSLVCSMKKSGWVGVPLVTWGEDDLITGAHRYPASLKAGLEAPTIDLEDVFNEAGMDFELHWEAAGEPSFGEPGMEDLINALPEEILEKYGIQYG